MNFSLSIYITKFLFLNNFSIFEISKFHHFITPSPTFSKHLLQKFHFGKIILKNFKPYSIIKFFLIFQIRLEFEFSRGGVVKNITGLTDNVYDKYTL